MSANVLRMHETAGLVKRSDQAISLAYLVCAAPWTGSTQGRIVLHEHLKRKFRVIVRSTTTVIRNTGLAAALLTLTLTLGPTLTLAAGVEAQPMQAGQTFRDCTDCPEMVVVPAGGFVMGSSPEDTERTIVSMGQFEGPWFKSHLEWEYPRHAVTISRPFALGKYLVTRGEFAAFVRETGYAVSGGCVIWVNYHYLRPPDANWQSPGFSQTDRDPVVCVNWDDAQAYVAWLTNKLHDLHSSPNGTAYGLPSEAEWEYAARAGTETAYWWGNSIGSNNSDCDGCGSRWDRKQTAPVGSFAPNSFGLFDMLGNAWEWTEDCWNENYADGPVDDGARERGNCAWRVFRGGSWNSHPWVLRATNRSAISKEERGNDVGFRVMRTLR